MTGAEPGAASILAHDLEEIRNQGCKQLGLQKMYETVQRRLRPLVPPCCMTDTLRPKCIPLQWLSML